MTEENATGGQWRSGFYRAELSSRFTVLERHGTTQAHMKDAYLFIMPPDGRQSQPEHVVTWTRVAFHGLVGCQLTAINATAAYIMRDTRGPRTVFSEKMEYTVIPKGRGFVYACRDKLYRQVKKEGNLRYLKCCMEPCDGSAKLQNGEFKLLIYICTSVCIKRIIFINV